MKLQNALVQKLEIIDRIENNLGEISEGDEMFLTLLEKEIQEKTDDFVYWYKSIKEWQDQNKALYQHRKMVLETTKKNLDSKLIPLLERLGRLKSHLSSIGVVHKKTSSIEILDFDKVVSTYPESVTISLSDDNTERVMRISKTVLKDILDAGRPAIGFQQVERESTYIDARVK